MIKNQKLFIGFVAFVLVAMVGCDHTDNDHNNNDEKTIDDFLWAMGGEWGRDRRAVDDYDNMGFVLEPLIHFTKTTILIKSEMKKPVHVYTEDDVVYEYGSNIPVMIYWVINASNYERQEADCEAEGYFEDARFYRNMAKLAKMNCIVECKIYGNVMTYFNLGGLRSLGMDSDGLYPYVDLYDYLHENELE
jgi:hypothetical protein